MHGPNAILQLTRSGVIRLVPAMLFAACYSAGQPEPGAAVEAMELDGGLGPEACTVGGCAGEICAESYVQTPCHGISYYACFPTFGICERDSTGACGWRESEALRECLEACKGSAGCPPR